MDHHRCREEEAEPVLPWGSGPTNHGPCLQRLSWLPSNLGQMALVWLTTAEHLAEFCSCLLHLPSLPFYFSKWLRKILLLLLSKLSISLSNSLHSLSQNIPQSLPEKWGPWPFRLLPAERGCGWRTEAGYFRRLVSAAPMRACSRGAASSSLRQHKAWSKSL